VRHLARCLGSVLNDHVGAIGADLLFHLHRLEHNYQMVGFNAVALDPGTFTIAPCVGTVSVSPATAVAAAQPIEYRALCVGASLTESASIPALSRTPGPPGSR
jgi:hypothetical protein